MNDNDRDWEFIEKYIQNQFNIKPDVHNILFLVGVQELGYGFQQLDQAAKTKVINFASMYIMNYLNEEEKKILKNSNSDENCYKEETYKTGIINYFKSKKII